MATLPSTVRSNETKYKLPFRITKNMYQYVQRTAWSLNISSPKNQKDPKDPKDPRNRYVHDRAKEKKNRFRDINIILKNHEKDHRSGEGREKWRARAIFRPRFRASPFIFGLAFIALRNFFSPCAFREREDVREGERGRRGMDTEMEAHGSHPWPVPRWLGPPSRKLRQRFRQITHNGVDPSTVLSSPPLLPSPCRPATDP